MYNKYLLAAVGAGALLTAGAGTAQAVPAYAFAELHFQNFTLSGVVDSNGNPLAGVSNFTSSVTSTDSANYPGSVPASNSAGGSLVTGTDAAQATSGPGAFPGENTFTQALLPANALTPAGTRGDTQITGALAAGATSNLVSEGKLSTPVSAGSSSATSTTLSFTLSNTTTINLTFAASSALAAQATQSGDSANAQTSASFKIFDSTTSNFVLITDNINAANSSTNIAPVALNQNVATTNPAAPQAFSSPLTAYSYTATLRTGDSYQLTVADSTTTIFQTRAQTVPEPVSLALLGSGLVAVGLTRRRKA